MAADSRPLVCVGVRSVRSRGVGLHLPRRPSYAVAVSVGPCGAAGRQKRNFSSVSDQSWTRSRPNRVATEDAHPDLGRSDRASPDQRTGRLAPLATCAARVFPGAARRPNRRHRASPLPGGRNPKSRRNWRTIPRHPMVTAAYLAVVHYTHLTGEPRVVHVIQRDPLASWQLAAPGSDKSPLGIARTHTESLRQNLQNP